MIRRTTGHKHMSEFSEKGRRNERSVGLGVTAGCGRSCSKHLKALKICINIKFYTNDVANCYRSAIDIRVADGCHQCGGLSMHISSTKALASSTLTAAATYADGGVPHPERSTSPSAWAMLVPMTVVLTLLALLETVVTVMFDPNLLSIIPG